MLQRVLYKTFVSFDNDVEEDVSEFTFPISEISESGSEFEEEDEMEHQPGPKLKRGPSAASTRTRLSLVSR